ncbi:hypothetical protein [Myroides sp. LJL119]
MKRILVLCLMFASIISAKAQEQVTSDSSVDIELQDKGGKKEKRNNKKVNKPDTKLKYTKIKEILDNADNLKLNTFQKSALNIKNEYIKRDMQKLNSNTVTSDYEKKTILHDLSESYGLYIQKILTPEQIKEFTIVQTQDVSEPVIDKHTLREKLRNLDKQYQQEVRSIRARYKGDKSIYYAQRKIAQKSYEYERYQILEAFSNLDKDQLDDTQDEYVMSLEEIANIYKAYDDYYTKEKQTNPLDFLEISEEYPDQQEEYLDVYPDEM